ncbi:MAG: isoprenylcysteine carboxylmethyltransferase family protein, partial [Candidatus Kapabacteria bacterium]|nr:isoprenylcysteine carboxylmethyltransferase family protein [Candidatus Kapabacteria bacterium]MDW8226144.1 isoprenylcysteine carboxylmethyltransferase family protein [Bacteroidota bacterium]
TPLLFDPPRKLVRTGPFRYMRNPMYFGVLSVLAGEALLLRSWGLALLTFGAFVCFNAFLFWFEEPQLRRRFGEEYLSYAREVPRWLPHPRAFFRGPASPRG